MKKVLVLMAAFALTGYASADILWDQSNIDIGEVAVVNQEFTDFAEYASYLATDVTAASPGWYVHKVTTYFTINMGNWPTGGNLQARLNVIPRVGCNLPDDVHNPANGMLVNAQLVHMGTHQALVADGLNVEVLPGDYWVSLTPLLAFGTYGQEFHYGAPIIECNTAFRNPGGGFGYGGNWMWASALGYWGGTHDASILIEGQWIPEPASVLLLGLAGLLIRRR